MKYNNEKISGMKNFIGRLDKINCIKMYRFLFKYIKLQVFFISYKIVLVYWMMRCYTNKDGVKKLRQTVSKNALFI